MLAVVFFVLPSNVYAYLDPGTGSMILQTVIAVFLGAAFIIKTQWRRLKAMFNKKNQETQDKPEDLKSNEQG